MMINMIEMLFAKYREYRMGLISCNLMIEKDKIARGYRKSVYKLIAYI